MNSKLLITGLFFALALQSRALNFSNDTHILSAPLNAVAYNGDATVVAVGAGSVVWAAPYNGDGLPWALHAASPTAVELLSVTYGGGSGLFLAGGANAATFTSSDGANWTQRPNAFGNPARV